MSRNYDTSYTDRTKSGNVSTSVCSLDMKATLATVRREMLTLGILRGISYLYVVCSNKFRSVPERYRRVAQVDRIVKILEHSAGCTIRAAGYTSSAHVAPPVMPGAGTTAKSDPKVCQASYTRRTVRVGIGLFAFLYRAINRDQFASAVHPPRRRARCLTALSPFPLPLR